MTTITDPRKQEGGVTAPSYQLGPARPPSVPLPFLSHRTMEEMRAVEKAKAST